MLQRKCACGGSCPTCKAKKNLGIQTSLRVNEPSDRWEREADRVADQVMSGSQATIQDSPQPPRISRKEKTPATAGVATGHPSRTTNSLDLGPSVSLPKSAQNYFGNRLGQDLSGVRVHNSQQAHRAAESLNAKAFTSGNHITFAKGQYQPQTRSGKHLIAHELTHVIQQSISDKDQIQRSPLDDLVRGADEIIQGVDESIEGIENEVSEGASWLDEVLQQEAENVIQELISTCNSFPLSACPNPDCPSCFCSPLPFSRSDILIFRDIVAAYVLPGIAAKVSPRVVPLWTDYIYGGSGVKNLNSTFGGDFMLSSTTLLTNDFLRSQIEAHLVSHRPTFPSGVSVVIKDIASLIPTAITQITTPNDPDEMNFNVIGEIPGNIAGGIGTNQTSCSAGACPSPINDERLVNGTVTIIKNSDNSLTVIPSLIYTVKDTIDLCPGNCGENMEQVATLPLSWLEASGVSGDIPFTVDFNALIGPITIP